ncbi:asparagine synthetase B [Clostridia bacterium]|nr:asparagine synthetase B [Clostridia bacterium]
MCGIAGFSFYDEVSADNMKESLKRRGPDQDGIIKNENVTLIHTRLAVVDLEHGLQPMSKNGISLVYNGELYNTEELRKELQLLGQTFDEKSDTEVVLKSYLQWGNNCVNHLNGIFAFAIVDNEKIFIARDRMGVKPFFYAIVDGKFIFASEIKALLSSGLVKPEIDNTSLFELILIGPGRTPGYGIFKNINELKKAHCGIWDEKLEIWEYWKPEIKLHTDNFEETVKNVRFLVEDSIRRQTVSDVPLCTFLSGGLDSSIISAITADVLKEKGQRIHTFSVDYEDNSKFFKSSVFQPNTDSDYIKYMVEHIGSVHHSITLTTEDVVGALYEAVDARDLPGMADIDSSLLLFCKEVKKDFTVALSGECSDEIFGGYPWYRNEAIRNIDGFPWSNTTQYKASFLKEEYIDRDASKYVYEKYQNTIQKVSGDRFREMTELNLNWFMQTLLDRKDRMSMYNGLEVRVPFCDYRLVEYTYNIPWCFKDYKDYEKGLLREAVKDILPEKILWRKKSPYPKTHNPLYFAIVLKQLQKVINDKNSPILQFIKKDALEQLLKTSPDVFSNHNWYGQLMALPQTIAYFLQLNYWLKKYNVTYIL